MQASKQTLCFKEIHLNLYKNKIKKFLVIHNFYHLSLRKILIPNISNLNVILKPITPI